ncbi:MAG: GNAT family N-acetyltransferase [Clostridiales bacterium]|jgi:predicted acetyltransferase|nr:GNAT family N-acetyltransferase [Clostridiales bacterium]
MRIISDKALNLNQPHAMTIGKFDGMHLGHMALIKKTIEYAKLLGIPSMVFTFQPNPAAVLSGNPFEPLISEEQKAEILSGLGIDILLNYPFDRAFARISPAAFMGLIFEDLRCRALTVGESFCFGKDRKGEAEMLKSAGKIYGAAVEIVKNIRLDGEPVSSSRIREAAANNDLTLAERLLGRPLKGIQMSIRRLDPSERDGIKKIHSIAFNARMDFSKTDDDPFQTPADWIWGYFEDRRMVSGINAIPYKMRFDGHTVSMCGIGGVASLPEARRGGKIFAILQKILEDEYEKGTEFSNLTPFSHSFYRRMGYELCNCRQSITTNVRNFEKLPVRGSFTQHFPGDPLDELNTVFTEYIKNLNHAIPRDSSGDMRRWEKFTRNDPYNTGVCTYIWHDESGAAKGYIQIRQGEKQGRNLDLTINELAFTDPEALYGTLAFVSLLRGSDITWQAPAYIQFSDIIPENWEFSTSIIPRDMTRVVRMERALKLMRRPDGRGVYRIEVNDPQLPGNNGVFQIEYADGESEVTRVDAPADLTAGIPALSQLITGFRCLDSALLTRRDLILHGAAETLRKVFTARPSHLTEEF